MIYAIARCSNTQYIWSSVFQLKEPSWRTAMSLTMRRILLTALCGEYPAELQDVRAVLAAGNDGVTRYILQGPMR